MCDGVSETVSQKSAKKRDTAGIRQEDILNVIKSMKPSTSLARLEEHNRFRLDFERRLLKDGSVEKGEKLGLGDVVGIGDIKKAVKKAIEVQMMHPELVKKFGIEAANGILIFGPPGTREDNVHEGDGERHRR